MKRTHLMARSRLRLQATFSNLFSNLFFQIYSFLSTSVVDPLLILFQNEQPNPDVRTAYRFGWVGSSFFQKFKNFSSILLRTLWNPKTSHIFSFPKILNRFTSRPRTSSEQHARRTFGRFQGLWKGEKLRRLSVPLQHSLSDRRPPAWGARSRLCEEATRRMQSDCEKYRAARPSLRVHVLI